MISINIYFYKWLFELFTFKQFNFTVSRKFKKSRNELQKCFIILKFYLPNFKFQFEQICNSFHGAHERADVAIVQNQLFRHYHALFTIQKMSYSDKCSKQTAATGTEHFIIFCYYCIITQPHIQANRRHNAGSDLCLSFICANSF